MIQDNVDINNTDQFKKVKPRSSNPNKRKITILGDSIVRHIESKKMRMGMKANDGIYILSHFQALPRLTCSNTVNRRKNTKITYILSILEQTIFGR